MHIVVVGAGAIGTVITAALEDVTVVARGARLAAIRMTGIVVETPRGVIQRVNTCDASGTLRNTSGSASVAALPASTNARTSLRCTPDSTLSADTVVFDPLRSSSSRASATNTAFNRSAKLP